MSNVIQHHFIITKKGEINMEKLSIIRQLFLGNSGLLEHVKVTEEYRRLMRILAEFDEVLTAKLESNSELYELFEKFKRANDEVTAEEVETFYEAGIKFGALLGIELMKE